MLVKKARRHAVVASADQDKPIFYAIPGYLAAARGFARLMSATLAPPKASQPSTPESTFPHPDASWSMSNDAVAALSQHNHRRHRVRHCRKLSLGSVDSGIDMTLDATIGLRTSTDNDMHIGKVMPTLTMGHGHPLVQVLAELATPSAQFVQHMAPVPVLVRQPGDPPLGNQGPTTKQPLTAAQIKRRRCCHQQRVQRQPEARQLQDPIGVQLEATQPSCTRCGAKLWLPV